MKMPISVVHATLVITASAAGGVSPLVAQGDVAGQLRAFAAEVDALRVAHGIFGRTSQPESRRRITPTQAAFPPARLSSKRKCRRGGRRHRHGDGHGAIRRRAGRGASALGFVEGGNVAAAFLRHFPRR